MFGLTLEDKFKELVRKRLALKAEPDQWWNRNTLQHELHKVNREIDKVLDERSEQRSLRFR